MCAGHNSRMLKLSAVTTHTTKRSYCMKSRSCVVEAAAAANRSLGHGRAAAMGRRGGEQRLSEAVRVSRSAHGVKKKIEYLYYVADFRRLKLY